MKTIILCGGIGYRLKEETEFKPKPMVLIGRRPILWHIMKIYSHYGFNEFIIALGYKGEQIKDYFLQYATYAQNITINTQDGTTIYHQTENHRDNFIVTLVDTGQDTLPGERILRVKGFIPNDEDFMVTYGDGVADIDIPALVKFHKSHGKIGTVTGVHPKSKYGLLEVNKSGVVQRFTEKPVLKDWVNGGFMVFKKEFFSYLRKGEFEHKAIARLMKKRQLSVYTHNGFWSSMDTYTDVDNLNQLWNTDPKWRVWK